MTHDAATVGFQGEPGAFSEQAVLELLPAAQAKGYTTFDDLVAAVDDGEVEAGLLPVENSIYGTIARSYDLLWQHAGISIIDETSLHVVQSLIAVPGARLADIREVRSHPVALEQCRKFFVQHAGWQRTIVDDTAGAVREIVAAGDVRIAAIASAFAAKVYGGEVIAVGIQDDPQNFTRFLLISRETAGRRMLGRACVALGFPSRVGALRDALSIMADADLNLRSLVSRPSGDGPFQYRFYCEIENGDRERIQTALARIDGSHRILGVY